MSRSRTMGARGPFGARARSTVIAAVFGLGMFAGGVAVAQAQATFEGLPTAPGTSGDQLLYFYDQRPNRTTFFTVGNTQPTTGVTVEIVFYSQNFDTRLAETVIVIPGGGATVVDPASFAGVPGNGGLATVTPIVSETDHTPVVPPRPLVGGFTIVNLQLGAGFGDNAFGRLALQGPPGPGLAQRGAVGAAVDGASVSYQNFQPLTGVDAGLTLPVYFNPNTLAPADQDGNRVLLAAFNDAYGAPVGPGSSPRFNLAAITNGALVNFYNSGNGQKVVTNRPAPVTGVEFESLQSLSGNASFTSSGRLDFTLGAFNNANESFFGTSSQSLGTFAGAQRLIPVDIR